MLLNEFLETFTGIGMHIMQNTLVGGGDGKDIYGGKMKKIRGRKLHRKKHGGRGSSDPLSLQPLRRLPSKSQITVLYIYLNLMA